MPNEHARPPVSVVIPTFNGADLLRKHLPSVLRALRTSDELVIVDDASSDATVSLLIDLFKLHKSNGVYSGKAKNGVSVSVLVNETNLRFGASVNRGIASARHPLIVLINNDVSPDEPAISRLVEAYRSAPDTESIFAIGVLEIEPGDLGRPVKGGKNKLWFERGLFMHSRANNFDTGITAWVSGGSGLFVREKWLELGGFKSDFYPAYWEDIDISRTAQERGWKTLFLATAIMHHRHETTNKSVFSDSQLLRMSWKNADVFTWKHADIWQKVAFLLWRPYWWWQRAKQIKQNT